MNIFWLEHDRSKLAESHCDKHVVKMILEYAQLLSTAHHVLDGEAAIAGIYKKTHVNHPCAVWVRQSHANYYILLNLLDDLCEEYTHRYDKVHKTAGLLDLLYNVPVNIPRTSETPPPLCMPDEFKVVGDPVTSYRNYYLGDKARMLKYTNRIAPKWIRNV